MIIVYLIFGIAIALTVVEAVQQWQDERADLEAPVVQVPAHVVTIYSGHNGTGTSPGRKMLHYAVFELNNGERKNFEIGSLRVTEGAKGTLTYQGSQFRCFTAQ